MMRRLSAMICRHVEAWRNREITSGLPGLRFDCAVLSHGWAGGRATSGILMAIGIRADGRDQVLGVNPAQQVAVA